MSLGQRPNRKNDLACSLDMQKRRGYMEDVFNSEANRRPGFGRLKKKDIPKRRGLVDAKISS
jgi:hypothetical protein